ncbi:ABC transporter H family member 2 [Microplitis demolitor]|uniref:ABC transporter H family member 2 n=1 Tax=Microplitis demolitor TaxID=69319 RepID=UPI0006D526ED|nr:ABC transporter H family member 2 [Microplitis demolitor]
MEMIIDVQGFKGSHNQFIVEELVSITVQHKIDGVEEMSSTDNDQPLVKKRKLRSKFGFQINIEEADRIAGSIDSNSERVVRQFSQLALEASFSIINQSGIDINNEINTEINISIRNDANNFEDNDNCTDESKFDTNQNNDSETSDKDNEITERGSHTIVLNNNDRNQENTQERRIILNKIRNVPIFSDKYCIVDVTQSNGKNRKRFENFQQYLEYEKEYNQLKKRIRNPGGKYKVPDETP